MLYERLKLASLHSAKQAETMSVGIKRQKNRKTHQSFTHKTKKSSSIFINEDSSLVIVAGARYIGHLQTP
jgi:hypothetical protein